MLLLRIWFYIKTWYLLRIQGLIKSDFTEISGFLWILFILFLKNCVTNSILEKKCLNFSTSTPTQSSQIFAILVPFCFIIITLMFFCRSKLLFFGKTKQNKKTLYYFGFELKVILHTVIIELPIVWRQSSIYAGKINRKYVLAEIALNGYSAQTKSKYHTVEAR